MVIRSGSNRKTCGLVLIVAEEVVLLERSSSHDGPPTTIVTISFDVGAGLGKGVGFVVLNGNLTDGGSGTLVADKDGREKSLRKDGELLGTATDGVCTDDDDGVVTGSIVVGDCELAIVGTFVAGTAVVGLGVGRGVGLGVGCCVEG